MRRFFSQLALGVLLLAGVVSCIDNDIPNEPPRTKADEMADLKVYLDTLEGRGLDIDTTDLGVYYVVDKEGNGTFPQSGDTCIVNYSGFFMNGMMFDASHLHNSDSTFQFVLNTTPMIKGWEDGMKVVAEESRTYLIIPSEHAYGSTGYGGIGPYETLIFDIKMKDIK